MTAKFSLRAKEDYKLVRRALEHGDQNAYTELMGRYKDSLYYVLLRMVRTEEDAEDLTLEAFSKAFKNLEHYDPNYSFSTWLYRIGINNAIDFIRHKKRAKSNRDQTVSIDTPIDMGEGETIERKLESQGLDPEEKYIKQQRNQLIRDVVDKLGKRHQKLIELRYFQELSYQEIADKIDKPLGTVKAQLFRAREMLMEILKKSKGRL